MKHTKILLFVAALCATTLVTSANVIEIANFNWIDDADTTSTVTDKTVEKDGITLNFNGRIVDATYKGVTYRTLRVYAEQALTISCADKITKIEVIGIARNGANIIASAGTVVGGDYSSQTSDTYKYENGFDDPLFVVNDVNATSTVITSVKQLRVYGIRVTTEADDDVSGDITVTEALAMANALVADTDTSKTVTVIGYVSQIKVAYSEQYSNVSFYMSDDATVTTASQGDFLAFRVEGDDAATVKVGDKVKVTAKLINYKGNTPETVAGGTVVIVVKGEGDTEEPDQDGPESIYDGYYKSIHGLSGDDLLWAIYKIISVHDSLSYDNVRGDRTNADLRGDDTIWDIYSNCSLSTSNYCNNTNYDTKTECECHNREHILPKSWWGGVQDCRYSDLVNVYPTDNATNQQRSAWCYGNVTSKTWSNSLGTKLGTGKVGSWSGTVFEPIDEYKGDVARIYCYMVACYLERQYNLGGKGFVVFNYNNSRCGFTNNGLNWMLGWHRLDPVSSKEKERNTVVLNKQKNRNPFVDFPNLVEYIWGNKKGEKFYVNSAATTASDNADALTVTTISGLYTEHGRIVCDGEFQIFDLLGRNITRLNGQLNGIYIVKVGDKAQKVVVP